MFLFPDYALAEEKKFQWSTRIAVSEQYDDNINLEEDDADHDWITSISPGLSLIALLEQTDVQLDYDLSYLDYARDQEDDEFRHHLTLSGFEGIRVSDRMTLDLDESLYISEDPVEADETVTSVRRTRNRYYRNTTRARLNYAFGEGDLLYIGGQHILLENEEPSVEDSQSYGAMAGIAHWFTIRHGLSADFSYDRGDFDRSEDFDSYDSTVTYTYRFSPATEASLSYRYDFFDYREEGELRGDYGVHSARMGLSHQFTERTSTSISGGYFVQDLETGDGDDDGFDGEVSVNHRLENGALTLGGSAGYRQQFVEAENLGFSKFYRASANFTYQLLERANVTLTGFYIKDDYQETTGDREDETWGGAATLDFLILRWLSANLSYEFRERDSTISDNDYTDNRVTLRLVAFYLSRPRPF
jgi:hypothetical protein